MLNKIKFSSSYVYKNNIFFVKDDPFNIIKNTQSYIS